MLPILSNLQAKLVPVLQEYLELLWILLSQTVEIGELPTMVEDVLEGAADGLTSVTITGHEKRRLKTKVSEGR